MVDKPAFVQIMTWHQTGNNMQAIVWTNAGLADSYRQGSDLLS